ncbi:MAG TPA: hypothetical protein VFR90_10930 [Methylibium sp.]|uniref:hypothetical protein n=1 Tax=Methylibium sp. TaxID=2067992 RepID=UPI002DBE3949|nr:hypothetical protein [Methylibium sp.]HEU4459626.1 hypothetical protein [Methylibium sp.]
MALTVTDAALSVVLKRTGASSAPVTSWQGGAGGGDPDDGCAGAPPLQSTPAGQLTPPPPPPHADSITASDVAHSAFHRADEVAGGGAIGRGRAAFKVMLGFRVGARGRVRVKAKRRRCCAQRRRC